jgi:hypothetical protein
LRARLVDLDSRLLQVYFTCILQLHTLLAYFACILCLLENVTFSL